MALRTMPDGSTLDTETGTLSGFNPAREAAAKAISNRAGTYQPSIPNRGQQIAKVVEVQTPTGPKVMHQPAAQLLAVSPNSGMGTLSDSAKRMLLTGLIVAGAFGAVWLNGKLKSKPKV